MITAKNYAAQAMRGLEGFKELLLTSGDKHIVDAEAIDEVIAYIEQAQHFSVIDGGRLLELKEFKSLLDRPFRLPYPITTIEFYNGQKNLTLAREYIDADIGDIRIAVYIIMGDGDSWVIVPLGGILSEKVELADNDTSVVTYGFDCLPEFINSTRNGKNFDLEQLRNTVAAHVIPLCEFIAALSCTNVGTETHQEAYRDNAKRISKGKLPIYETKTLTLNVTKSGKGGAPGGCGSSTPKRQHFRRGYIRHLVSGNYWVNACIVGKNRNGRIDKDYVVK